MLFASIRCRVQYVRIPKCASTAIKAALLEADGQKVANGYEAQVSPYFKTIPDTFHPDLVFTFVRHPISRLISAWREKLKLDKPVIRQTGCPLPQDASFAEWCDWVTSRNPLYSNDHWKPQHLMVNYLRRPQLRFIGKLETLEADWAYLRQNYGLPELRKMNKSRPSEVDDLPGDVFERVVEYYRKDFAILGYTPCQPSQLKG